MSISGVADAGGNNIKKTGFYCSFKLGEELHSRIPINVRSTNEAEYQAVILLLENINLTKPKDDVIIHTDSKLVVEQVNGNWRVHKKTLLPYYLKVIGLLQAIHNTVGVSVEIVWWSRTNSVRELGH